MSKYTIDLYTLKNNDYNIFNFDYDFYTDDKTIKSKFESKFIDNYLFNEIGQETVARFEHYLKTKLNLIMPYYKQLYQTELETLSINFMLNKDLTEETIRELDNKSNNNSETIGDDTISIENKESYLENGIVDVGITEGKLTGVNTNTTDNDTSITTTSENTTNQKESVKFSSQGNIGITSSAHLLKEWRSILINIDNLIIDECKDLFMQIY